MRSTLARLAMLAVMAGVASAQAPAGRPAAPGKTPAKPAAPQKTLDIYIADVEGGKATLFVTPAGETVLIDTGNPGARDHERIMAVLGAAGVKQLDYVLSTHYHVDHIGGLQELAKAVPIKTFVDHGPSVEEREQVQGFQAAYADLYAKARHIVVKPGDKLPLTGVDWRIVTSAGKAIKTPLPGGGKPNPHCAGFTPRENLRDPENGQSVGSVVAYGRFRTIDLGDLLWNNEGDLMCPNNPIGTVDLYLVSHHGTDPSGSAALVHALEPRVAIMQNGTRKGGTVQTSQIINASPKLEHLWQVHWSYNGGIEHNPAGLFIANVDEPAVIANVLTAPPPAPRGGGPGGPGAGPAGAPPGTPAATPPAAAPTSAPAPATPPPSTATPSTTPGTPPADVTATASGQPGAPTGAPTGARQGGPGGGRGGPQHTGPAHWIKVSARADGSFTVTNTRNGFTREYAAR